MRTYNINPGNSGGPLINLAGEVIAVNTFGDVAERGQGLAGSISVKLLVEPLADARAMLGEHEAPSTALFPCLPDDQFPLSALQNAALRPDWPVEMYNLSTAKTKASSATGRRAGTKTTEGVDTGPFLVNVFTPPHIYRISKAREIEAAKNRSRRSDEGASGDYDPFEDLKSWTQYAGGVGPVVHFYIMPKIGATGGSQAKSFVSSVLTGALLGAASGTVEYEFKADVSEFDLFVEGDHVEDLQRGLIWMPLDFHVSAGLQAAKGSDLARVGVFTYDPRHFLPDEDGNWPKVTVRIVSSTEDARTIQFDLPQPTLERIAIDFQPYYWSVEAKDIARGGSR